jgi:WD40 repeat protein
MIQWTLKPATKDVELPYELMKAECTIAHSGKNIWAVAQDWSNALATGGADGAIALHHAHPSHNKSTEIPRTVLDHCADGDTFRTYRFVAPNVLLSTTDKGRIVLLDTSTLQGATVKPIAGPLSGLRGYSVVESIEHVAFIGGTDGCVYSYSRNQDKLVTVTELGKKIAGLFTSRYQSNGVALLVTGQGDPAATLLLFSKDVERPATGECKLALPPGFVVTSFALLDSKDTCYAILGSRNGSIAISGIEMAGTFAHTRPATVCSLVYGKEAVTSLHSVTSESCDVERNDWIFSCGRDGTFAVHRISSSSGTMEIHLVHQLALPFGPNVEGLDVSSDGEVRILGFRSKHFVVYDINAQRETMSVECGGAHRNWTFQPDEDGGTFTWTKASKVYKITQSHMSHELINAGGHGREIKAVASCPGSTKQQIFATGAEDTNIKLFKLVDGGFICLQTLRKHNTGIQHLQWSRDGQYLFSSGGFEEFFVWKINFDVPYLNVGVVCESMHPRCGTSDLRISGFDVQIIENAGSTITMAYSDSTVKIWHYVAKTWQQLVTADYLTACLTHVLPDHRYDPGLVTAATDGHIVHWQLQNNQKQVLTWVGRHRVHQNAIHAAISHSLPDGSTLIVTGGDDNAIGFTRVAVEINTLLISDAHAAAVTGLTIIPSSRSVSNFRLASSGVDQRVKIWEVEFDYDLPGVKGINVRRVQDVFTAVADVSGLEVCRLEDGGLGLLICGVGMDVWRLST